ncbi:MAG: hypothetical protein ABI612_20075 [Betaproteobacteria bacterium]
MKADHRGVCSRGVSAGLQDGKENVPVGATADQTLKLLTLQAEEMGASSVLRRSLCGNGRARW